MKKYQLGLSDLKTIVLLSRMDSDQMPGTVARDFWKININLYKGCTKEAQTKIKRLLLTPGEEEILEELEEVA